MKDVLEVRLKGLNCANCAGKIEDKVKSLNSVDEANLNFINKEIKVMLNNKSNKITVFNEIVGIVKAIEPDVKVYEKASLNENENEDEDEDNFLRNSAVRFILGGILFIGAILTKQNTVLSTILFVCSYLSFGVDVIIKAVRNIFKGDLFDENFLMSIATIGAFIIGEYPEAVAVMFFYQIGEFFQDLAVDRSRKSIKNLMNIKPESANLIKENDIFITKPEDVSIGDLILVKPGEKIPLDGIVKEGNSYIDMSALIGESEPRSFSQGASVLSGAINKTGVLKIEVTSEYNQSTVSKILELVENAGNKKSATENFITKFAKIYTPIVVAAALLLAVVPSILTPQADFSVWISRALVFLVSSCPCALVVSVPLSFFSGIGAASKRGILIKGSNYIQVLNEIDTVVFDKTGTLTKGVFEVSKIKTNNITEESLLKYAYSLERFSNHPVGSSIIKEYKNKYANEEFNVTNFEEIGGFGLKGVIDGKVILAGNSKLMEKENIKFDDYNDIGTVVYIAYNNKFLGYIVVADSLKKDTKTAIAKLKQQGIKRTVMLTGDRKNVAESIGKEINIDEIYSELLPQNKVENVEKLYNDNENSKIAFVGDGINDAPVLARADVGIAMGGVGSDAAIEAADVVIMTDELSKICEAVTISKNTIKIVKQNICFVLIVKFAVLLLAAVGFASMWLAVFADVGVSLISILNSMKKKY